MATKGRLATGMDADITIFDPLTVDDRATYTRPGQYSAGIIHVLVNGEAIVRDGEVLVSQFPGKAVRSQLITEELN